MLDKLRKAVVGDNANATIKSGTLVTTRGIGVILVGVIGGLLLLDSFDYGPWKELTTWQKFVVVLASGFIWALVAGSDAVARGLSAGNASRLVPLPPGLRCTYTVGEDSSGWHVAATRIGADPEQAPEFLIVKGSSHQWAAASDLRFSAS